jgi:hypothetical protein
MAVISFAPLKNVTGCVDHRLTQADVVRRGTRADQVDRRFARRRIETAPERLAVDGHHLAVGDLVQRGDPAQQTTLELRRHERPQNGVEPVVRGNSVRQIEELFQPLPLLATPLGEGDEIIGARHKRAHRNGHNVDQRRRHLPPSRIGQRNEVVLNASRNNLGHGGTSVANRGSSASDAGNTRRITMPYL